MEAEDSGTGYFDDLCAEFVVDHETKAIAFRQYERIKENYTLEGDPLHWVACALYEAFRCRKLVTVNDGEIDGAPVSLTRLLKIAKLSLIQFFDKMKKWSDMRNLPDSFRYKVDRIERNFNVSHTIFTKYTPIFTTVFKDPSKEAARPPRSRKQRPRPCNALDLYEFAWRMFVLTKVHFPNIGDDLINSYHLLLCVIDWIHSNAVLGRREDLISQEFSERVEYNHELGDEALCIVEQLCREHEGLTVEVKGIKEHYFKSFLRRCKERSILRGSVHNELLSGVLDINWFDDNVRSLDRGYDEYLLTLGDFDERVFLGRDANDRIGTPSVHHSAATEILDGPSLLLEAAARNHAAENGTTSRQFVPNTPLTGRHHLPAADIHITPVSNAVSAVSRLHSILNNREGDNVSEELVKIFSECSTNPRSQIKTRVEKMGKLFCTEFTTQSENLPAFHSDFANKRLQTGVSLYYKTLEKILISERSKLEKKTDNPDLSSLLAKDIFHQSLFACCLEIVIFCYNNCERIFPWILAVFDISPYYFYKVIELIIRTEEGFSRDVIKHLNSIEEGILDCLAWKSDSPLWDQIENEHEDRGDLPSSLQVTLASPPTTTQTHHTAHPNTASPLTSPVHPQIRKLTSMTDPGKQRKDMTSITLLSPPHTTHHAQSPVSRVPLASDRFSSPTAGTAKRRLFPSTSVRIPSSPTKRTIEQITIPVTVVPATSTQQTGDEQKTKSKPQSVNTQSKTTLTKPHKSRTGSLALFFRKVYHLASVRLKDLCERLRVDDTLRKQIWTTFEYCIRNETSLFKDRHIDQFIMCSVYAVSKISGRIQVSFQDIWGVYRLQPQSQSHIYRSVLIARLPTSQSLSQTTQADSQSSDDSDKIYDRIRNLRSSSTLPASQNSQPTSAPPTPTRPSGRYTSVYENEERGDLIKFYNSIYVKNMKQFLVKFQSEKAEEQPALADLPTMRLHQTSPRRVSNNHSLYISPHKRPYPSAIPSISTSILNETPAAQSLLTPNSRMLYCFNKSPAKDLEAINHFMKKGIKRPSQLHAQLTSDKRLGSEIVEGQAIKRIKFAMN